jgi:glycosyltransferase involved in cell wall biosynthesis
LNNISEKPALFSIGIPAFKAKYLNECIDSILRQTYANFELIIVNDASPEDLETIVKSFTDSRIKYYCNDKNFGAEHVVDNWNKCLSIATGDFFVLMGDDDKCKLTI